MERDEVPAQTLELCGYLIKMCYFRGFRAM